MDFILVFIEIFSLGVTAEALEQKNIDWKLAFLKGVGQFRNALRLCRRQYSNKKKL